MTRINAGISPKQLVDQHLLAEYRELPRIFTTAKNCKNIPESFTFYSRWNDIMCELNKRGFNLNCDFRRHVLQNYKFGIHNVTQDACIIWEMDVQLVRERIIERLKGMENIRYKRQVISKQKAISLLKKLNNKTI